MVRWAYEVELLLTGQLSTTDVDGSLFLGNFAFLLGESASFTKDLLLTSESRTGEVLRGRIRSQKLADPETLDRLVGTRRVAQQASLGTRCLAQHMARQDRTQGRLEAARILEPRRRPIAGSDDLGLGR